MKKRKYTRVDVSSLTPGERKKYKKRLADTRKYTRARYKWERALRLGQIDKKVSLADFRNLKEGKIRIKNRELSEAHADNLLIDKLQQMIDDIKSSQERNSALAELLSKLG